MYEKFFKLLAEVADNAINRYKYYSRTVTQAQFNEMSSNPQILRSFIDGMLEEITLSLVAQYPEQNVTFVDFTSGTTGVGWTDEFVAWDSTEGKKIRVSVKPTVNTSIIIRVTVKVDVAL